jgi:hypothetical protein
MVAHQVFRPIVALGPAWPTSGVVFFPRTPEPPQPTRPKRRHAMPRHTSSSAHAPTLGRSLIDAPPNLLRFPRTNSASHPLLFPCFTFENHRLEGALTAGDRLHSICSAPLPPMPYKRCHYLGHLPCSTLPHLALPFHAPNRCTSNELSHHC